MTDVEEPTVEAEVEDNTELVLWTWGLSGQPSSWALSTWGPLIDVIRLANQGEADVSSVQEVLDATFPDKGYDAGKIVLAHPPVGLFTATVDETAGSVRVDLAGDEDLLLPDDNVSWDFGDGTLVFDAGGWDHPYATPGEYPVRLNIMVGGSRSGSGQLITIGDPPPPVVDPGVAERPATVFESETDDRPNTSVSPEDVEAQAAAVADYIGGGAEPVEEDAEYDPGDHTVEEVLAYVADHPDEADDIYAAEEAGKGRVTILDKLA